MVRFLDAENLKIITKSDHVIFQRNEKAKKNFIIQIGKQGLVRLEDLGIHDIEETFGTRVREICSNLGRNVFYDKELANYVSEEAFKQM